MINNKPYFTKNWHPLYFSIVFEAHYPEYSKKYTIPQYFCFLVATKTPRIDKSIWEIKVSHPTNLCKSNSRFHKLKGNGQWNNKLSSNSSILIYIMHHWGQKFQLCPLFWKMALGMGLLWANIHIKKTALTLRGKTAFQIFLWERKGNAFGISMILWKKKYMRKSHEDWIDLTFYHWN